MGHETNNAFYSLIIFIRQPCCRHGIQVSGTNIFLCKHSNNSELKKDSNQKI